MQGAQNGPPSGGPRHWVAGGPVRHHHGMRDGMSGRGKERGVARAAQQPVGDGKPWEAGIGSVTGCRERDIAGLRTNQSREEWVTESTIQQPRGCGKPVAMEW